MKKRMMIAMAGFVALLLVGFASASGCAKTNTDPGATSNGATVFFPNISI